MSFHHTQVGSADWGRRTMRATGCAAALLLALTGCFGGSQSENSSSTPSPSSTANHSKYPASFLHGVPDADEEDRADRHRDSGTRPQRERRGEGVRILRTR